jgi:hypothetical protein
MAQGGPPVSAAGLAALIAAGFFAAGMIAAVYVLLRLAGLISAASRALADYHGRASALIEQASSAVDRAHEQLARTDAVTASMDEVTANMAELSGHMSALASLSRSISAGFGTPLLRLSALVFGVRRALALRSAPQHGSAQHGSPRHGAAALPEQPALPQRALPQRPAAPQQALSQPARRRARR